MAYLLSVFSLLAPGKTAAPFRVSTLLPLFPSLASMTTSTGGLMASGLVRRAVLTTSTAFLFAAWTDPTIAQQTVTITFTFQAPSPPALAVQPHFPAYWNGQPPVFANGSAPPSWSPAVWESTSPTMVPGFGHLPGAVQHQTYQPSFMGQHGQFPTSRGLHLQLIRASAVPILQRR